MKQIKKILKKLSLNDMHVKELNGNIVKEVCKAANHNLTPIDTHYIMQGDKIIHVGNLTTISSYALRH